MKVGDKVLCIKTAGLNEKNSYYTIREVNFNRIIVTTDDDPNKNFNSERHYFLHTKIQEYKKFSDHFITLKELRKEKIKKLNSI